MTEILKQIAGIEVYKIGGGPLRVPKAVKRILLLLKKETSGTHIILVISAFGKQTNALEKYLDGRFRDSNDYKKILEASEKYHQKYLRELELENHEVAETVQVLYKKLRKFIPVYAREESYAHIVSTGEMLSASITKAYLENQGVPIEFADATKVIVTDEKYRDATINLIETKKRIEKILPNFRQMKKKNGYPCVLIISGFIGSMQERNDRVTTLGREGSDYTAGVIGAIINTPKVTLWKGVKGVMTNDPKKNKNNAEILHDLTYDAVKLIPGGEKIIHTKTIDVLKEYGIPLYVRPFFNFKESGTRIN